MVKQFLKIAGVKTEEQFYKKYPTEAAFFKAHPEAKNLKKMKMGGGVLPTFQEDGFWDPITHSQVTDMGYGAVPEPPPTAYTYPTMPVRGGYGDNEEQYQADADQFIASLGTGPAPSQTAQQVAAQVIAQGAPQATAQSSRITLNPYQGVSVWDFLTAQGKKGDLATRKEFAKKIGIDNYTGKPEQNRKMMEMIRQTPDLLAEYPTGPVPSQKTKSKIDASQKGSVGSRAKTQEAKPKSSSGFTPLPSFNQNLAGVGSQTELRPLNDYGAYSNTGWQDAIRGYEMHTQNMQADPVLRNQLQEASDMRQYFNEELQKTLGKQALVALSAAIPGIGQYIGGAKTLGQIYRAVPMEMKNKIRGYIGQGKNMKGLPSSERPFPGFSGQPALPPSGPIGLPAPGPLRISYADGGGYPFIGVPFHTYDTPMAYAYGGMYQAGGMMGAGQQMMGGGQDAGTGQELVSTIAEMIQQGTPTRQIEAALVKHGMDQKQAKAIVSQVKSQMSGAGSGMPAYQMGGEYDLSQDQIAELERQGYKFEYKD